MDPKSVRWKSRRACGNPQVDRRAVGDAYAKDCLDYHLLDQLVVLGWASTTTCAMPAIIETV